jgi:DNA-binding IclR family transcriptional regulator
MSILSTAFGRVELSGKAADRFQRHMTEDKPNPAAKASLARGQAMLARIESIRQAEATQGLSN